MKHLQEGNIPITTHSSSLNIYGWKYKDLKEYRPRSRVCWAGWKSMLMGDDPWFKVRKTVFGKSSGALKAWPWPWPGNGTGNTLTGRFTWTNEH
jgi:hypothetical protein